MTTAPGPVLDVKNLSVRFGAVTAVRDVSFSLAPGQRVGLVGESGSGKSVTALTTMRLTDRATTSGSIIFDGVDLLALPERRMRKLRGSKIAMVYQDPMSSLNPVHTIGRQLVEAITIHQKIPRRQAFDRAIELLTEVGVKKPAERMEAYPHQFSGGMRQRVVIAMALAGRPDVLIADEPTTALDVTIQARIIDLLEKISEEHRTAVLLITHDLGVAAGFCEQIHVMQHGLIVESAPVTAIYDAPQHPYTKGLLGAVVDLNTDVARPIPVFDSASAGGDPGGVDSAGVDSGGVDSGGADSGAGGAGPSAGAAALLADRIPGVPEPDAAELIRVDSLVKTFILGREAITAVDQVSFSIRRGQTFGLVGESGSGKSTVSRLLLGLTPVDSGQILFENTDIAALGRAKMRPLRRRMQMVFQDPFAALNRRHTVMRLVTAPLAAHQWGTARDREEKARAVLDLVGLDASFHQRYPRELSGGQCQRVAIARALVLEPDFLILDEAVSALDVSLQAQVLNLLRELQSRLGLTYLFVSHDLGVVRYMCSEIAVMQAGRIVEQASREELFAHPRQEYTRSLLAAVPTADPVAERHRRALRQGVLT